MRQPIKRVKNRFIKLLRGLDKQEGFAGMLLVMLISVAIFTILSSVHIYTVNHAQYQSRIKEAYGMQIEVENFAVMVSDAYNQGRNGCDPLIEQCCTLDTVRFKFRGSCTTCCTTSEFKPDGVCIESPANKIYCLVKIKKNNMLPAPPSPSLPSIAEPNGFRSCLFDKGQGASNPSCSPDHATINHNYDCSTSVHGGTTIKDLCQQAEKHSYPSDTSTDNVHNAINECCSGFRSSVIDCNNTSNKPANCENYETSLTGKYRMWCEICEASGKLFTYYICPATPGPPPDTSDCTTKMAGNAMEKAQSGVFYQTFRVLAH